MNSCNQRLIRIQQLLMLLFEYTIPRSLLWRQYGGIVKCTLHSCNQRLGCKG